MSVFFVDCPKILFWSVLSLSCCCLFKIYTSYIISKCKSVKMINIPWFLVPHFYLLSVQSYKRLKLRAFKAWLFCKNQWKANLCRQNQYFRKRPYVHTSWAERYTCLLVKKSPLWEAQRWLFHSAYFCDWGMKKDVFFGINFYDVAILWNECGIYFYDPNVSTKIFQPSLKKKIQYIWE